jgi:hypothetical protein
VGHQFRRAIGLYYERSPGPLKQYPPSLEALLHDARYPSAERYLRKVYVDPLSGKPEWGLVEGPGGTVTGVHSLSRAAPLKTGNFAQADQEFEHKAAYADWQFVYVPQQMGLPTPATGATLK